MALSRIILSGTGATNVFTVNFALGYLDINDVTCRVGTEVDGLLAPIYRTITPLSTSLMQISGAAPGLGVPVTFERTVASTSLRVDFEDDKVLSEATMNTAQKQALMLVHQVLDGRFAAFSTDIDVGGFRLRNVADPLLAQDVATRGWVLAQPGNNIQAAIDAAALATTQAGIATNQATNASNSAIAATAALSSAALKAQNLADLTNSVTARTNLGLAQAKTRSVTFIIDQGGSVLSTGIKGDLVIPFAGTITSWTLISDQAAGSAVVDIWKGSNAVPVIGGVITASAKPTLTAAQLASSSTLTGWTTALVAGDILRFNLNSNTLCTKLTLSLAVTA